MITYETIDKKCKEQSGPGKWLYLDNFRQSINSAIYLIVEQEWNPKARDITLKYSATINVESQGKKGEKRINYNPANPIDISLVKIMNDKAVIRIKNKKQERKLEIMLK